MDEEEKKAIDNMKSLLLYSKEHEYFSPFQEQEIDDMNIVLNIVEKQSKEIEKLQAINQMQKYRIEVIDERELISRDEVKNIIQTEIEKLNKKEKENLKGTKGQDRYVIKQEYMYKRSSLQSILDKIKGDDK